MEKMEKRKEMQGIPEMEEMEGMEEMKEMQKMERTQEIQETQEMEEMAGMEKEEEVEEALTQVLEAKGRLLAACSGYLQDEGEKTSNVTEYVRRIQAICHARFDETAEQLAILENMV